MGLQWYETFVQKKGGYVKDWNSVIESVSGEAGTIDRTIYD